MSSTFGSMKATHFDCSIKIPKKKENSSYRIERETFTVMFADNIIMIQVSVVAAPHHPTDARE